MQSESLKSTWTDKSSATEIFIIDVNRISRTEIDAAYFSMSEERRKKCDGFRFQADKDLCIVSDMLLRRVLSEKLGIPSERLELDVSENGKPYLKNDSCYFNVSHSGDVVAVAVNRVSPVGIDVEKVKPLAARIAKRVFSDSDVRFVFGADIIPDGNADDPDTLIRFFKVWTYKEAFVKMTGEGISDNIKNYSYDEKRCFSQLVDDYVITVITENV